MENSLFYRPKSAYELMTKEEVEKAYKYCDEYMKYLDNSKTERPGTSFINQYAGRPLSLLLWESAALRMV